MRGRLRVRFVVPGNVHHNSGGNVYNAALARELAALGVDVETCRLDGGWPVGSAEDRRRLLALLCGDEAGRDEARGDLAGGDEAPGDVGAVASGATGGQGRRPRRTVTLVDGLLGCGAPDELAAAAAAGRPAWILLHMPLADIGQNEATLERRALQAAAGVICTSGSAAARIRTLHGLDGLHTALPGTDAAAPATGSEPPHFLAVAALLPNKDQLLLLGGLAALLDLPWTASLVGSDTADPGYAALVRETATGLGLGDRLLIPGELRGPALEAEWAAADLSLLISQAETFGLVVTESVARGVPVIVRAGTGAVEALASGTPPSAATLPGAAVALGSDPAPLADVLRHWLSEPALRRRWRSAAQAARGRLPGWDATARAVLAILDPEHPARPPAAPPEHPAGPPAARRYRPRAGEDSPAPQAGGQ